MADGREDSVYAISDDEVFLRPSIEWFSYHEFRYSPLESYEFDAVFKYYHFTWHLVDNGKLNFYFDEDSVKEHQRISLVQCFNTIGVYVTKAFTIPVSDSFHDMFTSSKLPKTGVKFLVILKKLLDKLLSLMYGLDWDVDVPAEIVTQIGRWDTSNNKNLVFLNIFLTNLLVELNVPKPNTPFHTPSSKSIVLDDTSFVDDPVVAAGDHLYGIFFRVLVLRHIVCSLLVSSCTSHLRSNNVEFLFFKYDSLHDKVSCFLDKLSLV